MGQTDPALTYSISGSLASGDNSSTVHNGNLLRASGEDEGSYLINIGTLGNPNYRATLGSIPVFFTILDNIAIPTPDPVPGPLPTLDLSAFNATHGRNNEDENKYPRRFPRHGSPTIPTATRTCPPPREFSICPATRSWDMAPKLPNPQPTAINGMKMQEFALTRSSTLRRTRMAGT